jgi:hypothetical protein
LLLAAVERARVQRPSATRAGPGPRDEEPTLAEVLDHLAIPRRSAAARAVHEGLRRLAAAGALREGRRHGVSVWALSAAGRRQLRRARAAAGESLVLPEAPQRRAWREARSQAARSLPLLSERLEDALASAERLLRAPGGAASSDEWLELAQELHVCARGVGCALHVLREWEEPDERRADVDRLGGPGDARAGPTRRERLRLLRAGRRNPRLWGC